MKVKVDDMNELDLAASKQNPMTSLYGNYDERQQEGIYLPNEQLVGARKEEINQT